MSNGRHGFPLQVMIGMESSKENSVEISFGAKSSIIRQHNTLIASVPADIFHIPIGKFLLILSP